MKICPVCSQTYNDDNLNFCLNDGGTLNKLNDDAPPTVILNQPRITRENFENYQIPESPPIALWGNQNLPQNQTAFPPTIQGQNQTLPTVALVLGIFSIVLICCYLGIPLGAGAIVTGYLGLKNTNENPQFYGGRSLAIGGIVTGAVGLLISIVIILLAIIGNIAG